MGYSERLIDLMNDPYRVQQTCLRCGKTWSVIVPPEDFERMGGIRIGERTKHKIVSSECWECAPDDYEEE